MKEKIIELLDSMYSDIRTGAGIKLYDIMEPISLAEGRKAVRTPQEVARRMVKEIPKHVKFDDGVITQIFEVNDDLTLSVVKALEGILKLRVVFGTTPPPTHRKVGHVSFNYIRKYFREEHGLILTPLEESAIKGVDFQNITGEEIAEKLEKAIASMMNKYSAFKNLSTVSEIINRKCIVETVQAAGEALGVGPKTVEISEEYENALSNPTAFSDLINKTYGCLMLPMNANKILNYGLKEWAYEDKVRILKTYVDMNSFGTK